MLNNFIYAKLKSLFEEALSNGEVLDEAIVFIEDTKEIWNHGTYFDGNKVDLSNIETSILNILNTKLDNISDLETIRNGAALGATSVLPSDLATVAKTGSYDDLTNKPTIPSAVNESTIIGWGFTKNTGTYSKPSTGIPKSDLASAVQTSLDKANTALQSEQYKGTVTSVKINGTTKTPDTNGMVDLGMIEGGGGSSSGGGGAYAEVNHGTSDTTFTLTPNTFHVWDEVASLDLSFADETAGVANEYLFQFTSGATPTTLTLPDSIKWANDSTPSISENMIYQISVLKGLGSVLEFSNKGLFPMTLHYNTNSNKEYAKVYQELESRGVPGTLESGLLFVDYDGTIGEVTEYSSEGTRGLRLYEFGAPIYLDVYLASDGSMSSIFND